MVVEQEVAFALSYTDSDTPVSELTFTIVTEPVHGVLQSFNDRYHYTTLPHYYYYNPVTRSVYYKPLTLCIHHKHFTLCVNLKPLTLCVDEIPLIIYVDYKPLTLFVDYQHLNLFVQYKPLTLFVDYKPLTLFEEYKPLTLFVDYKPLRTSKLCLLGTDCLCPTQTCQSLGLGYCNCDSRKSCPADRCCCSTKVDTCMLGARCRCNRVSCDR